MGAETKIEWCDKTFNPWEGCVKVSPECDHCYAEKRDVRMHNGSNWGKDAFRLHHVDSYWKQPLKWNRDAQAAGSPARVFCGSLCDVCEDRRDLDAPRDQVSDLILKTPSLNWLLLSKRPQNFRRLFSVSTLTRRNVWAGTTVGVRASLWRIDALRETSATVRFLSIEPLLEDLGEIGLAGIHWVIVGGESGPGARPMHPEWARSIRDQCVAAGVPFFFKQWGEWRPVVGTAYHIAPPLERVGKKAAGRVLDGREWSQFPEANDGR